MPTPSQSISDLRQQFYGGLAAEMASLQALYNAGFTLDKLLMGADFEALAVGESVMPRNLAYSSSGGAVASGVMELTFFTARKSETVGTLRVRTGNTAAAATPTLIRLGVYTVAANGDGTLIASTPNDTTLLAATFSGYSKALSAGFAKVAGQRYAVGKLVVSAAAMPTFVGKNSLGVVDPTVAPRLMGSLAAQADLPGTFTDAALTNATNSQATYYALLP